MLIEFGMRIRLAMDAARRVFSQRKKAVTITAKIFLVLIVCICFSACAKGGTEGAFTISSDGAVLTEGSPAEQGEACGEASAGAARTDFREQQEQKPREIVVYVCGAVNHAGIYTLPEPARAAAAVEAAGGFSEEADTAGLNLACLLEDGQKILVPSKGDDALSAAGSAVSAQGGISSGWNSNETGSGAAGKININRADEQELQKIPGVGKARAAAIAAYRQEHGPFSTIEDIMKVSGIKQAAFSGMKDAICVD